MKNIVLYGMCMILLVVSIPFVQALTINDGFRAYGSAGVDGIIDINDTVTFEVEVDNPGPASGGGPVPVSNFISGGALRLVGQQNHTFTDCVNVTVGLPTIFCTKTININHTVGDVAEYELYINFTDHRREGQLYLDTTPPSDVQFSVQQDGEQMQYTVSATDSDNVGERCVGLGAYNISIASQGNNGSVSHNQQTSGMFNGGCAGEVSGNFTHGLSADGEYSVCVGVSDRHGYAALPVCVPIVVDVSPPTVSNFSFYLQNGMPLEYIPPGGTDVMVKFVAQDASLLDIQGSSLVAKRVINNAVQENEVSFSCQMVAGLDVNTFHCESESFSVESGEVEVHLELRDEAGNVFQGSARKELAVDTTPPVLRDITGQVTTQTHIYSNGTGNITLMIEEVGMGLHDEQIFARFGPSLVQQAESCEQSGNNWACVVPLPQLSEGEYTVAADPQSRDDAGNFITGNLTKTLVIDRTPPVISDMSFEALSQFLERRSDFAVAGGRVIANFSVTDATPYEASVNFTALGRSGGGEHIKVAECVDDRCTATSDPIGDGGSVEVVVITATDIVGNTATAGFAVKVLSIANESNHWKGRVRLSPEGWDREVAELISQRAFAEIELQSASQTNLISADFAECIGTEGLAGNQGGREYFASVEYVSGSDNLKQHYVSLESKEVFTPIDEIVITCRFEVSSFGPDELVPAETVEVDVIIPLYNNPYDMIDEAMQQKIDDAVDRTKGLLKTLDDIYKWVEYLEIACRLYSTITSILTSIEQILFTLGVIKQSLYSSILGAPAGAAVGTAETNICFGKELAQTSADRMGSNIFGRFCQFVSCQISPFEIFVDDDQNPRFGAEFVETIDRVRSVGQSVGGGEAGNVLAAQGVSAWSSDSIVTHALNLCVPGILSKISEYRAIQCSYVLCLIQEVQTGSMNEQACSEIRSAAECEFIYGEIFSIIPFIWMWDAMLDFIADMMSDWIASSLALFEILCKQYCPVDGTLHYACSIGGNLARLSASISQLIDIGRNSNYYFNMDSNRRACEDMESALSDLRDQQSAFEDKLRQRTVPRNESTQYGLPSGFGGQPLDQQVDPQTNQQANQVNGQPIGGDVLDSQQSDPGDSTPGLPDGHGGDV